MQGIPHKKIIAALLIAAVLLSAGFFLQADREQQEPAPRPLIEVDQILVKVVVKEGEFVSRPIRIANRGRSPEHITLEPIGVKGLLAIPESRIVLQPNQAKIVFLQFQPQQEESQTAFLPGVYVGKLAVRSGEFEKEIPVIIEVESRKVRYDMNLNPTSPSRKITQGGDFTIEVHLFNLQGTRQANVEMEYQVKDTEGNNIITESENVVIRSQAVFFKNIRIPYNLRSGPYVFTAYAKYGSSFATASYLFDIGKQSQPVRFTFSTFCGDSPFCWLSLFILAIIVFALGAYGYFFFGLYLYTLGYEHRILSKAHKEKETIDRQWYWIWIGTLAVFLALATMFFYRGKIPTVQVIAAIKRFFYVVPAITIGLLLLFVVIWIVRAFLHKLGRLHLIKTPEERERARFERYLRDFNAYLTESQDAIEQRNLKQVEKLLPGLERAAQKIEASGIRKSGKKVIRKKVDAVLRHRDAIAKAELRKQIRERESAEKRKRIEEKIQEVQGAERENAALTVKGDELHKQGIKKRLKDMPGSRKKRKIIEFNTCLTKLEEGIKKRDTAIIAAWYPKAKEAYNELTRMGFSQKAQLIFYKKMKQAYSKVKKMR